MLKTPINLRHNSSKGFTFVKKESKGFTLVELLVVISIIAILVTIGVSIYASAQKSARDGRRRSEIDTIAKSIETSKDASLGTYKYDTTMVNADFPSGLPDDPSAPRRYCVAVNTGGSTPPTKPTNELMTNGCPQTGGSPGSWSPLATAVIAPGGSLTGATIKAWTICTILENTTGVNAVFCRSSLTS